MNMSATADNHVFTARYNYALGYAHGRLDRQYGIDGPVSFARYYAQSDTPDVRFAFEEWHEGATTDA